MMRRRASWPLEKPQENPRALRARHRCQSLPLPRSSDPQRRPRLALRLPPRRRAAATQPRDGGCRARRDTLAARPPALHPRRSGDEGAPMIIAIFRSRLREDAREEYMAWAKRMTALAIAMPGYLAHKLFTAEDGERLMHVEFESEATMRAWGAHPEHTAAKRLGRDRFFTA